jgi:hypothetical protein
MEKHLDILYQVLMNHITTSHDYMVLIAMKTSIEYQEYIIQQRIISYLKR